MFFFYVICFFNKFREQEPVEQVLPLVGGKREVARIMYTHVSKCKNNKIKL
jgi:hypothetical protein